MLLNRQQRFDLYAHSARRAPLGRSGWPDGYRMIALIWPLLLSTTTSAAASRPHDPVSQKKAPLGRGSGSGDQRFAYSSSVSAQCGPSRTHKGRPAAKPSGFRHVLQAQFWNRRDRVGHDKRATRWQRLVPCAARLLTARPIKRPFLLECDLSKTPKLPRVQPFPFLGL
jgi:hypothetical protein